jgi:purine-binding chemotaxis protein CheW
MSRYPAQLCTFFVGEYHFGIDVLQVQEVLRFHEMTAVPLAPSVVRGLINLRGQIVTAMDLRRRLGLAPSPPEIEHANVIVRTSDGSVSLLVDEVGDVIDVVNASFSAPPPTLTGPARAVISGVCKLDRQLVLILDVRRTLEIAPEVSEP